MHGTTLFVGERAEEIAANSMKKDPPAQMGYGWKRVRLKQALPKSPHRLDER
jgi:hypothetical protein